MKRRLRRIANFFAFNLLFFALYLNFIHKDKAAAAIPGQRNIQATASVAGGTVPVTHPEEYLNTKTEASSAEKPAEEPKAANLSVN